MRRWKQEVPGTTTNPPSTFQDPRYVCCEDSTAVFHTHPSD